MQPSVHAHTGRWSGNPAVLGSHALRPVALRPRLSNGFALKQRPARSQRRVTSRTKTRSRIASETTVANHGRLRTICLVVRPLQPGAVNKTEAPPLGTVEQPRDPQESPQPHGLPSRWDACLGPFLLGDRALCLAKVRRYAYPRISVLARTDRKWHRSS
jgi:hypothetical protein